jgi:hypothetical protein
MKTSLRADLVAVVLLCVVGTARFACANLVTNPGFETGDFTGWTPTPAGSGSLFGVDSGGAHSGTYEAYFGGITVGSFDSISQSLATSAGGLYQLSFWLANDGDPPNEFRALFNGVVVTDIIDGTAFGYTQIVIPNLLATSSSTTLEFQAYHVPSFFRLDDISVDQTGSSISGVPDAGAAALLLGCSLIGLLLFHCTAGWRQTA